MSALNTVQIMMLLSLQKHCCNICIWLFFTDADPPVTVAY